VVFTSLLPRPKPLMTGPRSLRGNGGWGVSGPAMRSRGPLGRTIVRVWKGRLREGDEGGFVYG